MATIQQRSAKPIAYLLGAIALYGLVKYISFSNKLNVEFTKIRFGGSIAFPQIFVTLSLTNPTGFNVTVSHVSGSLYYRDTMISNVYSDTPINVAAGKMVQLELQLSSTLSNVIDTVKTILSKPITNDFFYRGTITVDGVALPVNSKLSA